MEDSAILEKGLERRRTCACEEEGELARRRGVSSADNPYLHAEPQRSGDQDSQFRWFRRCDSWWRGWDRESARLARPLAIGSRACFVAAAAVEATGPGKSQVLRSLGEREPGLRDLRGANPSTSLSSRTSGHAGTKLLRGQSLNADLRD